MGRTLFVLTVAVLGSFASPSVAEACSCVAQQPRCGAAGAFWRASAVFVGRVVSIESLASKSAPRPFGRRRIRMQVVEAFRGTGHPEVSVITGSGGGDCGYPFKVGQEYLVYASRPDDSAELTTGICSRTQKVQDAMADIEYGRQLRAGTAPVGRVLGEVWLRTRGLGGAAAAPDRPVRDVHVVLDQEAGPTLRTVSDDHGGFVVEGLPAGVYKVSAEAPPGFVASVQADIEVPHERSCVNLEVTIAYDGRIKGRVVDAQGRAVGAVSVQALGSASRDKLLVEHVSTTTLDDGTYELRALPPGRYVVGINIKRESESDSVDPRIFHPGVTASGAARILQVRASEHVAAGDLVLPASIDFVPLRGIVLDTAGVPVSGAWVYLKRDAEPGHIIASRETNERGEFVIAALAGRRYQVFAEYTGNGRKVNAPQSSETIAIEPAVGITPIRLVVRRRY